MKYIILLLLLTVEIFASLIKAPILSVDEKSERVSIKLENIDVGISGFIVHKITPNHSVILKNVSVVEYDKESGIATLKMDDFKTLTSSSLPMGKWKVEKGDEVQLAFAYSRALLVAPSEEIYHRITQSVQVEWVHPDIFAMILSYNGHPTPLKKDFEAMSIASSVGLLFIYLDKKVYTVDIKSFKILSISEAPLMQESVQLPFYSHIEEIEANWFGEGSDELEDYESYYYELLSHYNNKNEKFYEIIKNGDTKLHHILKNFEIGK